MAVHNLHNLRCHAGVATRQVQRGALGSVGQPSGTKRTDLRTYAGSGRFSLFIDSDRNEAARDPLT